ncbi:hypothetical protein pb186bvf_013805 [Paramecium bursaria]
MSAVSILRGLAFVGVRWQYKPCLVVYKNSGDFFINLILRKEYFFCIFKINYVVIHESIIFRNWKQIHLYKYSAMLNNAPRVLYLINPDPIFYGDYDAKIASVLRKAGAQVTTAQLNELSFTLDQDVKFFQSGTPIEFDAFLAYGYMAPKHYKDFSYFNYAVYCAGKSVLHKPETESILQNKLLQAMKFTQHQVPSPKSGAGFSIQAAKEQLRRFSDQLIVKQVEGYAGDGVQLSKSKDQALNGYAKAIWRNEQVIFQEFIKDSIGKSIRVLAIGGKAISATQFQDSTVYNQAKYFFQDFKSNGYSNDFSIISMMDSPKKDLYFALAEKAIQSVDPDMTIGGVDILDSEEKGLQVLEINSWPEMEDSQDATGIQILDKFAETFTLKINNYNKKLIFFYYKCQIIIVGLQFKLKQIRVLRVSLFFFELYPLFHQIHYNKLISIQIQFTIQRNSYFQNQQIQYKIYIIFNIYDRSIFQKTTDGVISSITWLYLAIVLFVVTLFNLKKESNKMKKEELDSLTKPCIFIQLKKVMPSKKDDDQGGGGYKPKVVRGLGGNADCGT